MRGRDFAGKFFRIEEIPEKIHIAGLLADHKVLVTYNQLMKSSGRMGYILLFNDTDIEIPSLVTYSRHFGVRLVKICRDDVVDVQRMIKHARMICVPDDSGLKTILDKKIEGTNDIPVDLSRIALV